MFDFPYFIEVVPKLLPGIPLTFLIAFVSFVIGSAFGLVFALIKIYQIALLRTFVMFYVSFFRGTPLLVQLFMFFYGIPIFLRSFAFEIDVSQIDAIYYALVVFSLYATGYLTEIIRSSILAVDRGQLEAAYSVGMTKTQAFRHIILPQALLIALPNLLNFFILQIKNTSLASVITVPELMGIADIQSGRSSKFLEVYCMAALMYWGMCMMLEYLFFWIEKRLNYFRKSLAS